MTAFINLMSPLIKGTALVSERNLQTDVANSLIQFVLAVTHRCGVTGHDGRHKPFISLISCAVSQAGNTICIMCGGRFEHPSLESHERLYLQLGRADKVQLTIFKAGYNTNKTINPVPTLSMT